MPSDKVETGGRMRLKAINRIELGRSALDFNLDALASGLKKETGMLVVVKSNAYGHGMIPIASRAARHARVKYLGVAHAWEAFLLREHGIRMPVLILGASHPSFYPKLIAEGITLTVSNEEEARAIDRAARRLKRRARVHVELDTGMGRTGIVAAKALKLLFEMIRLEHLDLEGLYTHFPHTEKEGRVFCQRQIEIFKQVVDIFRELYPGALRWLHMANSLGLARYHESHFNLVRPGIAAYGVDPGGVEAVLGKRLKPVLSLKSRLCLIKRMKRGDTISYARTYRLKRDTCVGVIPLGYSSGYPWKLSNNSRVLIRGRACPVIGRVTMDQIMVDLGPHPSARLWDEVVLIGSQGQKSVRAEYLAQKAGTIPYEILTSLNPQIERKLV